MTPQTPHEQAIRTHCQQHGIQIRQLPCKAFHFVGNGVDVIVTDLRNLTDRDLLRFEPDNDLIPGWRAYERSAVRR